MARSEVQLTDEQDRRLEQLAAMRHLPKAELIQEAVIQLLEGASAEPRITPEAALARFPRFVAG